MLPIPSQFFEVSGVRLPADLDAGQGKHLFLSRLDYVPFSYLAYFLLNFCALCCSYTLDQSRRKNVLNIFLPLPLQGPHPTSSYVQQGEGKREFFPIECMGVVVRRGISSLSHSPTYWPQYFLPSYCLVLQPWEKNCNSS